MLMDLMTKIVRRRDSSHNTSHDWINELLMSERGIIAEKLEELPTDVVLPAGWMSEFDLRILYNLAQVCPAPFLEIGPWIGRSTTAICAGLRDAPERGKIFDVLDFGICGVEEWKERFGYLPDFSLPDHKKGRVEESISAQGGTLGVLIENLRINGLLQFTTSIARGDLVTCPHGRKYRFVFIDAVHNQQEAERHLPKLRQNLAPGAVVIIDDVADEDFAKAVCAMLGTTKRILTNSFEGRNKLMVTY